MKSLTFEVWFSSWVIFDSYIFIGDYFPGWLLEYKEGENGDDYTCFY